MFDEDPSPTSGARIAEDIDDLYEHAPCGYLSLAPNGLIVKVNETICTWSGHTKEALLGKRFRDLLNIAGRIYSETHLFPLLRIQGFVHEVALDLIMNNGQALPVLVNAVERRDASGAHYFTRFMIFNATDRRRYESELLAARRATDSANLELKQLNENLETRVQEAVAARLQTEESLRQSQKMEAVGQLTGGIAHDFNNLLAGIAGSMELLLVNLKKGRSDATERYAEAALGAAKRAATLTHRLLAFSRNQKLDPKAADLNRLIADMEDLIRRSIGVGITLEVIGAGGLWPTLIDVNQFENALLNLCINARDAMPSGGRLIIETANKWFDDRGAKERDVRPGQYVCISVSDSGEGIAPDVLPRIFDAFFTTKPTGAGTGLGLSMVAGFARQSGGQVRVYSELRRGTTMSIYLPRHRGEIEILGKPIEVLRPLEHVRSETVLVVDDEPTVRMIITEVLQQCGFSAIEASDGPTALRVLQSNARVDMLITDVGLPGGMSGRQLAEAACLARPTLKVLFVTGFTENAAIGNGHIDHSAPMLTKPFTLDALSKKVLEIMDR